MDLAYHLKLKLSDIEDMEFCEYKQWPALWDRRPFGLDWEDHRTALHILSFGGGKDNTVEDIFPWLKPFYWHEQSGMELPNVYKYGSTFARGKLTDDIQTSTKPTGDSE